MLTRKNSTLLHIGILLFIIFLIYSNTLANGFVADDSSFIFNWNEAHSPGNFLQLLGGNLPSGQEGRFRPIRSIVYMFSYQLWGANALGYHIQALVVYGFCIALIYLITWKLLKKRSLAFLTSVFFAVHPIHTEAISYMTASFDSIGVIFFLTSFYLYIKKNRYYWLSVIFAGLSFFTYELTLSLPFIIILYDLCFQRKALTKNFKKGLLCYLPFFLLFFGFFLIRWLLHINVTSGKYLADSFYLTQLTMVQAYVEYIWLLLFPVQLSVNPVVWGGIQSWTNEFSSIAVISSQSILDPVILFSFIFLVFLFMLAWKSFKKRPLITFCIGWFFLSLLPVSYLLPQGFVMQERDVFIASFGFILLISYGILSFYYFLQKKEQKVIWRRGIIGLCVIIILLLSVRTYLRNFDFKDDFAYWHALSLQTVGGDFGHLYTGDFYTNQGDYNRAIAEFNQALKDNPTNQEALLALSYSYAKKGDYNQAKSIFDQANQMDPSYTNKIKLKLLEYFSKDNLASDSKQYQSSNLLFNYPKTWTLTSTNRNLGLTDETKTFFMEITQTAKNPNLTPDQYLISQKTSYGQLVNQGLAEIPSVDSAYVRIWLDGKQQKMQFFLFKAGQVVSILVYPPDSANMRIFDQIVRSMKIN